MFAETITGTPLVQIERRPGFFETELHDEYDAGDLALPAKQEYHWNKQCRADGFRNG